MYTIVIPVIFGAIVLVGTVGNILVIAVVLCNRRMHNTANILIVNLAVADLLFLVFCVPFTAVGYVSVLWPFGDVWCKIVSYLMFVTLYGSVYTLVLLSVSRYVAVVHSVRSLTVCTPRNAYIAITAMWIAVMIGNIYNLHGWEYAEFTYDDNTRDVDSNTTLWNGYHTNDPIQDNSSTQDDTHKHNQTVSICNNIDMIDNPHIEQVFSVCLFLLAYVIPLAFICVIYGLILSHLHHGSVPGEGTQSPEAIRAKRHVTKMVVIVVAVFAVCWLPNLILLMIESFARDFLNRYDQSHYVRITGNCLAYMNSCMNPIIYALLSDNFKRGFRALLCCSRGRKRTLSASSRIIKTGCDYHTV